MVRITSVYRIHFELSCPNIAYITLCAAILPCFALDGGFHLHGAPTIGNLHTMQGGGFRVLRPFRKPDGVSFIYPLENGSRSKKYFQKILTGLHGKISFFKIYYPYIYRGINIKSRGSKSEVNLR